MKNVPYDRRSIPRVTFQVVALGAVTAPPELVARIDREEPPVDRVLETARLAGIIGSKRAGDLVPVHIPLQLTEARVEFALTPARILIRTTVSSIGSGPPATEAMSALAAAAITLHELLIPHSPDVVIEEMRVLDEREGKVDLTEFTSFTGDEEWEKQTVHQPETTPQPKPPPRKPKSVTIPSKSGATSGTIKRSDKSWGRKQ